MKGHDFQKKIILFFNTNIKWAINFIQISILEICGTHLKIYIHQSQMWMVSSLFMICFRMWITTILKN